MSYREYTKPVYRGFNPLSEFYNKDAYSRNSIGCWTTFQSCTKSKNVALGFSIQPQKKMFDIAKEVLIFEIYLSRENSPPTQIDLNSPQLSWYTSEEEVLCLPFFTF